MGIFGRVSGSRVVGMLRDSCPDKTHWLVECDQSDKLVATVPTVYSVISIIGKPPVFHGEWEGPLHVLGGGQARSDIGERLLFFVHGVFANASDARKLLAAAPLKDGFGR